MPQASNEQRALMAKWFGDDGIDDRPPTEFLWSRGCITRPFGVWIKPTPAHTVSMEEGECIEFLCDEWDYGYNPTGRA